MSMHQLIEAGDFAGVRRMVEADPASLDRVVSTGGDTPLIMATWESVRNREIAAYLINKGAKLDVQNNAGWTALMSACRYDQPETAQLLVNKGAKLDLQNENGWTALIFACRHDQPETAQLLINKGAKLDLQNNIGWTALMSACRYGQPETAQLLINKGAKLDVQDNTGWTALMFACANDQPETAQLLINKGAKLDLRNKNDSTALMCACRYDQPDTAQLLIDKGAKLDLQTNIGNTALMMACFDPAEAHHTTAGMLRCVKLCYAGGADVNKKDKDGDDALALARIFKRHDAVAFLEFVTQSEVAKTLLGPLKQPRSVAVAFYDYGAFTLEDCKLLSEDELLRLGVDKGFNLRKVAARLGVTVQRRASLAKRISQRLFGSGSKNKKQSFDAFLTHDWGVDELERDNHARASRVNAALTAMQVDTWFDEERLDGNIAQQIAAGVQGSRKAVVFVTQRYMEKLMETGGRDYCRDEFNMVANQLGAAKMIPVVMEPRMLDSKKWVGPLGLTLGTHLFIDFSTDDLIADNISALIKRVKAA